VNDVGALVARPVQAEQIAAGLVALKVKVPVGVGDLALDLALGAVAQADRVADWFKSNI
jgi:hypothetical protein